ncbi:CDP-glycerol glycerophosphotransferase family protein [Streptomyces sp. NPDC050504]|uniref:CDP-glycerol glycerophosphotransferase family protein n=1 Tax=Streptomyces sp. NPDC050504 TaxID=3365618 RepID=UPI0037945F03
MRGARSLVPVFVLLVSAPLLVGCALAGHQGAFVATALAACTADLWIHRAEPGLTRLLGRLRLGVATRITVRLVLLAPLLVGLPGTDRAKVRGVALLAVLLAVGSAMLLGSVGVLGRRTRPRVLTRNVPEAAPPPTARVVRLLTERPARRLLHYECLVWLGSLVAALTGSALWVLAALACALLLVTVHLVGVLGLAVRARRRRSAGADLAAAQTWADGYRPDVVLYFSGSRHSAYQVNMWLPTLEKSGFRPLVLLREAHVLRRLDETGLPVLCVPSAVDVMHLDLPSVRAALYPANVGKNIHLLREPGMRHVFVGHGDSDKAASVNPFSKVYDEVWVSGPAGRDRYARAAIGVRDEAVVEVGRPQLDVLTDSEPGGGPGGAPREARDSAPPTVLYAPTWEGWTDEPGNTSLIDAGENIVRELLAVDPPVRILYKPHPFTGTRSPQARAAHERILRALAEGNVQRSASDAHAHVRTGADGPPLYECFARADALIGDVSSVVSDFVATLKPYAIVDTAGLGAEEFRRRHTAARGAYVLDPGAEGVRHLVDVLHGTAEDDMRERRGAARTYLLGPRDPESPGRFGQQLARLVGSSGTGAEPPVGRARRSAVVKST